MQSRSRTLLSVAGALLLATLPLGGLRAQQAGAMGKDEGSMASPGKSGMIHGAGGHQAAGTVHLVTDGKKHQIHFAADFVAEAGRDVYVVLSNEAVPGPGSIRLGKLERLSGEQTIAVPPDVDVGRYSHLLLWSKKDNTVIGMADLAAPAMGMEHDRMGSGMDHSGMDHSTIQAGEGQMGHDSMSRHH